MKLEYSTMKDEDAFILTDFNCHPAQEILSEKGLYKIIWFMESNATIIVDGYEMKMEKDQVIFCTPLNVTEVPLDTKGIISVVFNRQFFCIQTHDDQVSCNGLLFFGSAQPQIVQLCEKERVQFSRIIESVKEDFEIQDHLQGEMLRSQLKRMLILSTRMVKEDKVSPEVNNSQMNTIREYNLLVEKHFKEKHQVKDYADMLFKSPKTLSNLFNKYGNQTPLMVIHNRVMLEAKRLLLYSDKTAEEIAYELGFKDSGHFSKFFKKNNGNSPNIFRKEKLSAA